MGTAMKTYKVTLQTANGNTSYVTEGDSIQAVQNYVQTSYKNDATIQTYTVEPVATLNPSAMAGLWSASGSLLGCLMILIVAEWRIRKWLKE